MTSQGPLVSVVTVVRNEVQAVRDAVESMLRQRCDGFELEFLAVDGQSNDGSREILEELARRDPRLRVLNNPRKLTPHARNIGLRAADGEYVAMLDAHVLFEPDYIAVCLQEMRRHDAVACGGRVVVTPADGSTQAQVVAWTVAAPFVSSRKSMRTLKGGYVDTLPYPIFLKQAVIDAGAYDERLARNQDNDLTSRLLAAGHRLYLTPQTKSYYRPRPTLWSMIRYAARAGYWNGVTLRTNRAAISGRHLLPGAFAAVLLVPPGASAVARIAGRGRRRSSWLLPSAGALAAHLVGGAATAAQIFRASRRPAAALVPLSALAFHLAYGLGVLAGLPGPLVSERATSDRASTHGGAAVKRTVMHLTSVHDARDTRILLRECRSLVEAGYDVHLAAPAREDACLAGVQLHALPDYRVRRLRRALITVPAALWTGWRLKADLYHVHDPELIPVALLLRALGRCVVYDAHEDLPAQLVAKPWIYPRLRRVVARASALVERVAVPRMSATVAAREEVAERLARRSRRCVLVRNYAWSDEFGPPTPDVERERAVCFVGTVSENRGIEQLVRSLHGTGIRLLLGGRFSTPEFRASVAAQPGWEQVDELGFLDRAKVETVLRRSRGGAALFMPVPNHVDAEPTKVFEYMAAGLPVIGSNLPRIERIVTRHRCGLCVAPDDPAAIRAAILKIVDDRQLAEEMGRNGRRAVTQEYRWETQGEKLVALYHDLIGSPLTS